MRSNTTNAVAKFTVGMSVVAVAFVTSFFGQKNRRHDFSTKDLNAYCSIMIGEVFKYCSSIGQQTREQLHNAGCPNEISTNYLSNQFSNFFQTFCSKPNPGVNNSLAICEATLGDSITAFSSYCLHKDTQTNTAIGSSLVIALLVGVCCYMGHTVWRLKKQEKKSNHSEGISLVPRYS
ncbi:MAG: hypothetical protein P1U63_01775 [Coxiellaceae bacterium]|nr:hypothetical protein [Coxiellaceae bacterium]